jgi:hypothetical protein
MIAAVKEMAFVDWLKGFFVAARHLAHCIVKLLVILVFGRTRS